MRVLRNRNIPAASLYDVFRSTVLANITYCSPTWSGANCSPADRAKLDTFRSRCKHLGYCDKSVPMIYENFSDADNSLFEGIMNHVFYPYLPERRDSFSQRCMECRRGIAMRILSVCLSVCQTHAL